MSPRILRAFQDILRALKVFQGFSLSIKISFQNMNLRNLRILRAFQDILRTLKVFHYQLSFLSKIRT